VHPVRFDLTALDGAARAGTAHTARGSYLTPCFMPVGTRGAIKYLSAADYERLGAEIVLGNTYHLMLRPGAETVAALGGLGKFAGWGGLTLTDSGGFQVFSLDPKVDDDGVTFKSTYDGSKHRFTPEVAVHTQELLGADIQMVLDVCPPLPSPPEVVRLAVERTSAWAALAKAPQRPDEALFGIVRAVSTKRAPKRSAPWRSASTLRDRGLSVGRPAPRCCRARRRDRPCRPTGRYLMGVRQPGGNEWPRVDQFDCVMTRIGRHGTALTSAGKLHVKNAQHTLSDEPIDATCACEVCARHSRGYIRHLFQVGEPTANRLLSIHNVAWTLQLMARMQAAIAAGTFDSLRREVLAIWA
jgi:queuine tRNA-ribosyltransferase